MSYFTFLVSVNSFLNTVFMAHVYSQLPIFDRFHMAWLVCYPVLFLGYGTGTDLFCKVNYGALPEDEKYNSGTVLDFDEV